MNYAMTSYPLYPELKRLRVSDLAREVFGMLAVFSKKSGTAFVCRKSFADTLFCTLTSVSKAVTVLEKKGLIKRTGEFVNLMFPKVELTELGKDIANGLYASSGLQDTLSLSSNHHPVLAAPPIIIPNNSELKETTNSEKNVVVENLTKFGIAKNQAKRLKLKYPQEIITKQVQHLEHLLKSNTIIKNPAGWLIKAIENNFAIKIEEQSVIQKTNNLETQDKLKQQAKEQAMQDARRAISDEAFNKLYQEELNKLTNSLQRFGIISIAQHHKEAAHYNAMERLV